MPDPILIALTRLDEALVPFAEEGQRLDLYQLGRSALMLNYGFPLSTKDIDFVSMRDSDLEQKAIDILGKGTPLAEQAGVYLDPVPAGLPPLPHWFKKRCQELPGGWKILRLWQLEPHDLAVTKLKSFRAKDREDLQLMCDRGLLAAGKLLESLKAAFPFSSQPTDEDDPDEAEWCRAYATFRRVADYLEGKTRSL
jgi:hypothetical protein